MHRFRSVHGELFEEEEERSWHASLANEFRSRLVHKRLKTIPYQSKLAASGGGAWFLFVNSISAVYNPSKNTGEYITSVCHSSQHRLQLSDCFVYVYDALSEASDSSCFHVRG